MVLEIPQYAAEVILAIEGAGYEAYAVGGCVRDALLSRVPNDWDVTTSALPEEVSRLFSSLDGYSVIPTGMAHGTVTVLSRGKPVEVTTYRIDGKYTDFRRPDAVKFCRDLSSDLARRDFTVNAMAYSQKSGLVDLYGGADDLKCGVIRCVGDPVCRFTEDALRILRALRFAATLGFSVESATADAAVELSGLLAHVSRERIGSELGKLMCQKGAAAVVSRFGDVFREVLSGIVITDTAVSSVEKLYGAELPLMLAALLGDTEPARVRQMLRECRFDNKTLRRAETVSLNRGAVLDGKADVRRLCRDIGIWAAEDTVRLGIARGERSEDVLCLLREIKENGDCVSISQLAVGGEDLLTLGIAPKNIGGMLDMLLDGVIEGKITNGRDALMSAAKRQNISKLGENRK